MQDFSGAGESSLERGGLTVNKRCSRGLGAFVDVGVHQDGLIHISQLANSYVNDPAEVVAVGDLVRVKVLEIDVERKRIAVSRKQVEAG